MSSTGHPVGDAVLPAAMRLVGAVREGNPAGITEAIGDAYQAADRHPYWMTALVIVLAGLVPDANSASELLAWNR